MAFPIASCFLCVVPLCSLFYFLNLNVCENVNCIFDMLMCNGDIWRHMGVYGCVTDADECIRMHMEHNRYQVLGT